MSPRRSRRSQPARGVELALRGSLPAAVDDPLAHLGGGLAREGDRQDVRGIDTGAQQVDVASTSTVVLPVPADASSTTLWARIDGVDARRLVGRERARRQRTRRRRRRRPGADPGASSKSNSPGCGLFVTDVVLATDRREAAEIAGEQVVGGDRERAGLDRVGDRERLGAGLREHLGRASRA